MEEDIEEGLMALVLRRCAREAPSQFSAQFASSLVHIGTRFLEFVLAVLCFDQHAVVQLSHFAQPVRLARHVAKVWA